MVQSVRMWNLNGAWVKKLWSFVANSTCPFSICIRIVPSPLGCFLKWGQDHWLSVSNFRMTNHCDIDVQDAWSSMMICMFGGYHCCVVFFWQWKFLPSDSLDQSWAGPKQGEENGRRNVYRVAWKKNIGRTWENKLMERKSTEGCGNRDLDSSGFDYNRFYLDVLAGYIYIYLYLRCFASI